MLDEKGELVTLFQMQLFDVDKLIKFVEAWIEYPALKKLETEKKEDFDWNIKYGRVLSICDKHKEADERFKKAEELSKDKNAKTKANLFFEMASHAVRKKSPDDTEKYIKLVEEQDKNGSAGFLSKARKLYLDMANSLFRAKKTEKAEEFADKAIAADKDGKLEIRDQAKYLKVKIMAGKKDYDGTLKLLLLMEKEVKDNKLLSRVLAYIGNMYTQKKEIDKAIAAYRKMGKVTKDKGMKAFALYRIGVSYMRKQDYDKAIEKFNEMIEKYPKDPGLRYARSQIKQAEKLKRKKQKTKINKAEARFYAPLLLL